MDSGCIVKRYRQVHFPALELVWKPANAGSGFLGLDIGHAFSMIGNPKSVPTFRSDIRGRIVGVVSYKFLDKCIRDSTRRLLQDSRREW